MRKLIGILFIAVLLLPLAGSAQKKMIAKSDTLKNGLGKKNGITKFSKLPVRIANDGIIKSGVDISDLVFMDGNDTTTYRELVSITPDDSTSYVLDGKPVDHQLNGVSPKSIYSIDVLKNAKGSITNQPLSHKTLWITTKGFAVYKYQQKFSAFSAEYKRYLAANNGNDSDFVYVLNGDMITDDNTIKALSEIPQNKIKEIRFTEKTLGGEMNIPKNYVFITTDK